MNSRPTDATSDLLRFSAMLFAHRASWGCCCARNAIVIFMSLELMFNAANLAFVAFARVQPACSAGRCSCSSS